MACDGRCCCCCIIDVIGLFDGTTLKKWNEVFQPLLQRHIREEGHLANRGAYRYYVTLPWSAPFNDASIYDNNDILTIVHHLVGDDFVMCQLATDTPVLGSDYQTLHRGMISLLIVIPHHSFSTYHHTIITSTNVMCIDAPPLFPEWEGRETPPFQLAVNFPLVDITRDNGPFETTRGTHMMTRQQAVAMVDNGSIKVEPILMSLGDVLFRDVRHG
jgi:hypothetical protein